MRIVDAAATHAALPMGALVDALERAFAQGSGWARGYWLWLWLLRWLVPLAIVAIFVNALGLV